MVEFEEFEKFEAELGIKQKNLDNDMSKHNDLMSRRDKEIAIKKDQAKKTNTNN